MKHWNYLNVWSLKSPFLNSTSYRFRNAFPVCRVTRNTENYLWTLTKPGVSVSPSCFQSSSVSSSRSASFCFLRLLLLQRLCPGLGWTAVSHSHLLNLLPPLLVFLPFLFIQVAFAQGDRARAALAEPALLQWWTAGGEVGPKWSHSPSVCIDTSCTCLNSDVRVKCEREAV